MDNKNIRNMKRLNLTGVGLLVCAAMQAASLTPQQAIDRLNDGRFSKAGASHLETSPAWTARTADGTATAYIFNMTDGQGFRILSADDAAYAVLGYSDTGSIDPNNMSPELKWWLEQLGAQMEYYISKGATAGEATPNYAPTAAIEPLVKSKWNQDAPYYNDCPKIGSKQTYTGCVATSMAQVMYYHKYPDVGTGSNAYQWSNGYQTLKMDFSDKPFDWDNMLNSYTYGNYNADQADAVAFLMKSCGYSVNMNYGTDASGTQGTLISYALKNFFKYDGNINVKYSAAYSTSEWANMVYDNLKDCGPVIINGQSLADGGHSFICDGYNGQGYFHFNWGWGGMSDGWFLLECMNPESQGIGGASMGSAFNFGVNAIFGIQKPTGKPVEPQYGNLLMYGGCTAKFNGSYIEFTRTSWYPDGWYSATDREIQIRPGIIIEPIDGTSGQTQTVAGSLSGMTRLYISPGYYLPTTDGPKVLFPTDLPDGRYKVTIAIRDMEIDGSVFLPVLCPYGLANYVYVTIKDGQKTIQNIENPILQPEDLTLETGLYYSRYAQYKVKVKNSSDFELTETWSPALLSGDKIVMVGNVAPLTCAPKTESEIIWDAKMSLVNGASRPTNATQYTLAIVDPITNKVLGKYGEVTMNPDPGRTMLRLTSLSIQDCQLTDEPAGNEKTIQVYEVPDPKNFTVDMSYQVWSGYFDGVLSGAIYIPDLANSYRDELVTDIYNARKHLEEDATETLKIPVDFLDAKPGTLYSIKFEYTNGSGTTALRSIYFRTQGSGVNDVMTESTEPVRYFNLQGMELASPAKGQILIVKKGSKTFKARF